MIKIDSHAGENSIVLRLTGSWDMETNSAFRNAYRQALTTNALSALTLDLAGVDYIDSAALGMLLILQGEAAKQNVAITLTGCRPFVLKVLTTANFHKMFKIAPQK
jgi:anti-anti-sigma factor